ncbi:MAG: hypothetical protein ACRDBP_03090 [Luteolibacter sp.]
MTIPFYKSSVTVPPMKLETLLIAFACLVLPLAAQIQRQERKSLLDSDPNVVYLDRTFTQPIELKVIKEAPVFSDREGRVRLGTLKADQTVRLEAITDRIYRVRGQGLRHGIAGWVAPWAFSSTDPDFVANLKSLYERQIQVQNLIAARQVAVGMTLDEVSLSRGKPTKTSVRKTATGQSGTWEFIDFEDVKNYTTVVDSRGNAFRQLASITRVEKGKTVVEFEEDIVSAVVESEDRGAGNVKIIVPPLVFRW